MVIRERRRTRAGAETLVLARDVVVVDDGRTLLSIERLLVCEGETLAIIGPNGAGKSTLLHVLAGLRRPSRGELHFRGRPVTDLGDVAYRRQLAMVMQESLLLDTSVAGNVSLGLRFRGIPAAERERLVETWLRRLGVEQLRDRSARTLSGGEAQRVSLARALATEPALLLLDEPFAALDAPSRQALLDRLFTIIRETGQTTVLVTHDRTEALALADRVAVMFDGRIRQVGTPDVVFSRPIDEDVAAFVGVENVLAAEVRSVADGLVDLALGNETVQVAAEPPAGRYVWLALRPEDIVLWPQQTDLPPSSARNVLRGQIARLVPAGTNVRVSVDCSDFELLVLITRRSAEDFALTAGLPVLATFKATAAHLLERSR